MNVPEKVTVYNSETEEVGVIRRSLFENPAFNPDGLLVEIEDTRSGCVDCGTDSEPEIIPVTVFEEDDTDTDEEED